MLGGKINVLIFLAFVVCAFREPLLCVLGNVSSTVKKGKAVRYCKDCKKNKMHMQIACKALLFLCLF